MASMAALSANDTWRKMPSVTTSVCPAASAAWTRSQKRTVTGAAGSWLHAPEVSVGDGVGRTADFAEAAANTDADDVHVGVAATGKAVATDGRALL